MTIEVNKVQVTNVNSINENNAPKIAFMGTTEPIPNDSVEISSKKKAMSNGAKIASVLGAIGVIVGGILLHKYFSPKSATDAVHQTTKELSQAVKDLVTQGRMTQKEAELFNKIHNLEGEEFVTKAYELIAKDMNLEKVPKLVVSMEDKGMTLGHSGKDISIFIKGYEKAYGKEHAKEEIVNAIRHELEHYKQDLIIYLQKGEQAYKEAFEANKWDYIRSRVGLTGDTNSVLKEEVKKYYGIEMEELPVCMSQEQAKTLGLSENNEFFQRLYKQAFEHDTPIETIRTMTPCDFEKLHLTQEELAKADEYLEGTRKYRSFDWLTKEYFKPDGDFNDDKIVQNSVARNIFISFSERYEHNPVEVDAKHAGKTLRDKFRAFLDAIK